MLALNCAKIPKINIFIGESGLPEDFEVNGDLGEARNLNAKDIPICISSSKVFRFRYLTVWCLACVVIGILFNMIVFFFSIYTVSTSFLLYSLRKQTK